MTSIQSGFPKKWLLNVRRGREDGTLCPRAMTPAIHDPSWHGFGVLGEAVFFASANWQDHCFSEDSETVAHPNFIQLASRSTPSSGLVDHV